MDTTKKVEIATVLVAFLSLLISSYLTLKGLELTARVNEQAIVHQQESERPFLDFQYKLGIGDGENDGGFLRLFNLGESVAIITKVSASYEGRQIETTAVSFHKIAPKGFESRELRTGQAIGKGAFISIYTIPPAKLGKLQSCLMDRERKEFATKLKVAITYESLSHITNTATMEYSPPQGHCCPDEKKDGGGRCTKISRFY